MKRPRISPPRISSALFASVLAFAIVLVVWWTMAMWSHGAALEQAADHLQAGDAPGVARALGADRGDLAAEGRRLRTMFLSEGVTFLLLLVGAGLLYRAALRREERVRALQDRFLTGATHELKTPLASIRLGLETLQRPDLDADRRSRYLRAMLGEVGRLERSARNLLAAAGLRSAGPPLNSAPGDWVADVGEAIDRLGERTGDGAPDVRVRTAPAALPYRRDPEAIALVLGNLLENAVKYSPPGGEVLVDVRCEAGSAPDMVRPVIEVIDGGRGLVGDESRRVFEPYWRGAGQAVGGAGLGLHVVKELVEAHGGTVAATSAGRDRGSCFSIRWPEVPRPDSPAAQPPGSLVTDKPVLAR